MSLEEYLSSKPLYYTKFDPNRIVEAYNSIKDKIKHPRRVQLIGTNGKGSTGRTLAHLATKSGLRVGHFTSPHILDFKERFWIDGRFATTDELDLAHKKLFNLLGNNMANSLSYFEYQALLAFVLFEDFDLQVIEAGLGGEFDATTVASYELTIFTPIGLDHSDFLGDTLESVATTKLNAMAQKALLGKQDEKVYKIAKSIAKDRGSKLYLFKESESKNREYLNELSNNKAWANYLVENIQNALYALQILDINYKLKDLESLNIFGRFYKILPNLILDVGHNTLAAKAIFNALNRKVDLIFNILSDKNAKEVLKILEPKINKVHIIKLKTQRATDLEKLENLLNELKIEYGYFNGKIDKEKEYLLFGSFYVAEEFLKELNLSVKA